MQLIPIPSNLSPGPDTLYPTLQIPKPGVRNPRRVWGYNPVSSHATRGCIPRQRFFRQGWMTLPLCETKHQPANTIPKRCLESDLTFIPTSGDQVEGLLLLTRAARGRCRPGVQWCFRLVFNGVGGLVFDTHQPRTIPPTPYPKPGYLNSPQSPSCGARQASLPIYG